MLTAGRLKELLSYDPETGEFRWLVSSGRVFKGSVAGCLSKGYIQIRVDNQAYRAHRLAWLYVHGVWPTKEIDHIDSARPNNRIANLREATRTENLRNIGLQSHSTTGYKGVSKAANKYLACATLNSKKIHLGHFPTAELASEAYQTFAKANHGEFYRTTERQHVTV